jgi:hypothetical protein
VTEQPPPPSSDQQNPSDATPPGSGPGPEPEPDPTRQAPILPPPPPSPPPPSYAQAPQPPPDGPAQSVDPAGFVKALFDFSFSTFITPKVVRFVYMLATGLLAVAWLAWLAAGFASSAAYGLLVLLIGPIVMLVYLALIRMTLEFYLAITRMSEDIHHRLPRRP